jgi:hypothetical protein
VDHTDNHSSQNETQGHISTLRSQLQLSPVDVVRLMVFAADKSVDVILL